MKAKLVSGDIIDLTKDCDCITHDGPHWLHMDSLYKAKNRQYLNLMNWKGYLSEEIIRLQMKEQEMRIRGILEVIIEPNTSTINSPEPSQENAYISLRNQNLKA